MILRPIIPFLKVNVSRRQVLSVSLGLSRGLTIWSNFQSSQGNVCVRSLGQTRSITWTRLLANSETGKSNGNSTKSSTTKGDNGTVKDTLSKPEATSEEPRLLNKENGEASNKSGAAAEDASLQSVGKETDVEKKATAAMLKDTVSKVLSKPKVRVDLNRSSVERNFITPIRAMSDFLLKPSDLEGLRKTTRRSPYENEPPISVYWRQDVEARANEVWGSQGNLINERVKRDMESKQYHQTVIAVKRQLRDYMRQQEMEKQSREKEDKYLGVFGPSGTVVVAAVLINFFNFLFKFFAWIYTGSHSMFAETVHSLADTLNQLILLFGIYKSNQQADVDHPYGYSNMRYVASLVSGVCIFFVGTGLSLYHGVIGLIDPTPTENFFWAFITLSGSFLSEGATLLMAINTIRVAAKLNNVSFLEYVLRSPDPTLNVVLLEDAAAVTGIVVCGACMGITSYTGSHIADAVGSILVSAILASVAAFIIRTNGHGLLGRSIPHTQLEKINTELERDAMVRAVHDVKGIDMGNFLVRYKAEVDFDGRELARSYLDTQDLRAMLEEVKSFKDIDELESFMVRHGENIVDRLGGEIDRIERKLREKHPEIRHCDLEIL